MKKILVLFLTLLLVLLLVACDTSPLNEPDTEPDSTQEETEPTDTTQEYLGWEDIVLEPDKQDLPSYEDLSKINYDMTYDDVYEILGNPQRMILKKVSRGSGMVITFYSYCYVYEGSEDWLLYVAYGTTAVNKNLRIKHCEVLKEEIVLLTAEEALTHLREGMTYGEVSTKLGQHYRCQYNTNTIATTNYE